MIELKKGEVETVKETKNVRPHCHTSPLSHEEIPFHGGHAHKISEKVYHLMRGEMFELGGKRIFALGGATSHDKEYRKEGKSWWSNELPSSSELEEIRKKWALYGDKADIIITHCAPTSIQKLIAPEYSSDLLTEFLEELKNQSSYKKWFFGHYHIDKKIDDRHIAIFNKIIKVE